MSSPQDKPIGPRPISETPKRLDLHGYLIPWCNGQPHYQELDSTPDLFLPLYSDADKLWKMHPGHDILIKKIDDVWEFIDNLPYWLIPGVQRLRVMIDAWITPQGTTRFAELQRDPPQN